MAGVEGFGAADRLLGGITQSAEDELAVELGLISREILKAQQDDAPELTGQLRAGLTVALELERLRAKIGLLFGGRKQRLGRRLMDFPFYGRMVDRGRKAQVVLVTRRVKTRRVRGNGRNSTPRQVEYQASTKLRRRGPNKGTPIGGPYKLRVKARAAHPFVTQPLLREVAESHLSDFWAKTLARAGASS